MFGNVSDNFAQIRGLRTTNSEGTDKVCATRDTREAGICTFSQNAEGGRS